MISKLQSPDKLWILTTYHLPCLPRPTILSSPARPTPPFQPIFAEVAEGRLHHMGAGEAANVANTYARVYRMLAGVFIVSIFIYPPYEISRGYSINEICRPDS